MKASRSLGARLFWVVSRCAMLAYRTFPFRGHLPGAIAIIPRDNGFVAVHRNDGLGLAFPGGVLTCSKSSSAFASSRAAASASPERSRATAR